MVTPARTGLVPAAGRSAAAVRLSAMATPTPVEVLSAVFQVREPTEGRPTLHVLLHRSAEDTSWSLPGGDVGTRETLAAAARRHLGTQCGLTRVAHLEQLSMLSDPDRVPDVRTIAATYLGLVPREPRPNEALGRATAMATDRLARRSGSPRRGSRSGLGRSCSSPPVEVTDSHNTRANTSAYILICI